MTSTDTHTEPTTDHSIALATEIDQITAGLAALLAWSKAHPSIDLFRSGDRWGVADRSDDDQVAIVRAIKDGAPIGAVTKRPGTGAHDTSIWIERDFGGGIDLFHIANREQVCTRRVTGTETVEVPDPDAPKITVEREIVEWDCHPILEGAA